ncbi:4'-phosphopantetheinyl transferase family protein [Terasakiella pusilla]|uniref:4'-phosphopantetheinyl transferase family protein n=1 Tax=Terasakiella pusilla TaxID=64973 RepID=UPI003AA84234
MIRCAQINPYNSNTEKLINLWCSEPDFAYVTKYKSAPRQQASLAARCLLRMLSAHQTSLKEIDICMENGPVLYGANQKFYASVSHSADRACAVICDTGPIGIDIERISPDRNLSALIHNIYPAFCGDQQAAYHFWTLLEAYGKAKGSGLDFTNCATIHRHIQSPAQKEGRHRFMTHEGYALCLFALNGA